MFVPIDKLAPGSDLIADGRPSGAARPWLGITTTEARGRLVVGQVTRVDLLKKQAFRAEMKSLASTV